MFIYLLSIYIKFQNDSSIIGTKKNNNKTLYGYRRKHLGKQDTYCCNWALYLHSTGLLKVVIDVSLGCDLSR